MAAVEVAAVQQAQAERPCSAATAVPLAQTGRMEPSPAVREALRAAPQALAVLAE
jgi:hypothetical protein